jgi:hypothetical protein
MFARVRIALASISKFRTPAATSSSMSSSLPRARKPSKPSRL